MSRRSFVEDFHEHIRPSIQLSAGTTRNYDGHNVVMSGDRLMKRLKSQADKHRESTVESQGSIRTASQPSPRWILVLLKTSAARRKRIDCRCGIHNSYVVSSNLTSLSRSIEAVAQLGRATKNSDHNFVDPFLKNPDCPIGVH